MVLRLLNISGRQLLIATLLGVVLGLLSAVYAIDNAMADGAVKNGEWQTNVNMGSPDASSYLRAAIAAKGLMALRREEVIYFYVERDADGDALTADCDYELVGLPPDAHWWSVTVYGEDNFLIDNDWDLYSASGSSLALKDDGSFSIRLSAEQQPGNWIPTVGSDSSAGSGFNLTLRLYNPSEDVYSNLATTPLPRIARMGCDLE